MEAEVVKWNCKAINEIHAIEMNIDQKCFIFSFTFLSSIQFRDFDKFCKFKLINDHKLCI